MTDRELADGFAGHRPDAFEEAYRRYRRALYATARGVLASAYDAQDCVHDAVMHAWFRPHGFSPERGSLRAFLLVCVRNEALTRRRAAARRRSIEERNAAPADSTAQRDDDVDFLEAARVRAALAELPAEQRRVLELAYFEGRSQSEIAATTGTPLGTVKTRAALGLRKLANALQARTP